jgi:hypothetical protein
VVPETAVAETLAPVIAGEVSVVEETLVPVKVPPVNAVDETVVAERLAAMIESVELKTKSGDVIVVADILAARTVVADKDVPKFDKDETPVPPLAIATVSEEVNSAKEDGVVSS